MKQKEETVLTDGLFFAKNQTVKSICIKKLSIS